MSFAGVRIMLSVIALMTVNAGHLSDRGLDSDALGRLRKRDIECPGVKDDDLQGAMDAPCYELPILGVTYDGVNVQCGAEMTEEKTKNTPTSVTFDQADEGALYTLLVVDPQGAVWYGPGFSWLHWGMENIRGGDIKSGHIIGDDLIRYEGPTPPKGTGQHHYEFYIFRQKPFADSPKLPRENERFFELKDFVDDAGFCAIAAKFEYIVVG